MSTAQVQDVLQAILSPDNNTRQEAEKFLDNLKDSSFQQGIEFFIQGLQLQNEDLASLSALLLKKKYMTKKEDMEKIPQNLYEGIIAEIKSSLAPNKKLLFLKRLLDILVQMLSFQQNFQQLIDVMNQIEQQASNQDPDHKMKYCVLYLIEIVCEFTFDDVQLKNYSTQFITIFEKYLIFEDIQVRTIAQKTTAIFLSSINDEAFVFKFTNIFTTLLQNAIDAIKADEEAGKIALDAIAELIDIHPKFTKPVTEDIINLISQIIIAGNLADEIKGTALNIYVIQSQQLPAILRKSEAFKNNAIPAIMQMLMQIDKISLEEWKNDITDEIVSKQDPSSIAQDTLSKITPKLGTKYMLPNFISYIKMFIQTNEWQKQYAALMAISMMIEGAQDSFKNELTNFISIISPLQNSQQPQMIYAILVTYGYLCSEYTPEIQQQYHQQIIPFIISQMKNTDCLKLQYKAVSSLIDFCRDLMNQDEKDQAILVQYSQDILSTLQMLFQYALDKESYHLQEEILNLLSMVAVLLDSKFGEYYQSFMPGLKSLLNLSQNNPQQINIRVLTIECIGFLVSSISKTGSDVFYQDVQLIMQSLIQLQNSLPIDDPHHQAIMSVYAHFAASLKEQFAGYLPQIINKLLESFNLDIQFMAVDKLSSQAEKVKKMKNITSTSIDTGLLRGEQQISLNTIAYEQKVAASSAILGIIKVLGKQFVPYAEQLKQMCCNLLNFIYSKEIRNNALQIIYYLLQINEDQTQLSQVFTQTIPFILKELQNLINLGKNVESHYIMSELNKQLKLFKKPILPQPLVLELIQIVTQCLKLQSENKKILLKEFEHEKDDCDEDLKEEFQEDYEEINDLMQISMEVQGEIIKLYAESAEGAIINTNMPYFYNIFENSSASENEVLYALAAFDDIFEFCSLPILEKIVPNMAPKYLKLAQNQKNIDILQTIIYGLGLLAQRAPSQLFSPYYQDVYQLIISIIDSPDNQSPANLECTECTINALGKLLLLQPFPQNTPQEGQIQSVKKFLALLPLTNFTEEAKPIHGILLEQVQQGNSVLRSVEQECVETLKRIWEKQQQVEKGKEIVNENQVSLLASFVQK